MRASVQAMVRALISTIAPAHMDFTEATVNNSIALMKSTTAPILVQVMARVLTLTNVHALMDIMV